MTDDNRLTCSWCGWAVVALMAVIAVAMLAPAVVPWP